jgi:3-oxoacyl-[acyl-carrier protein] reductase
MSLSSKVALVTGGSKGIGYGIAQSLVQQGVNVMITSRHEGDAQNSAKKLSALGPGQCIGMAADVRKIEDQQIAIAKIIDLWGKLDVAIANAGVGHFSSIEDLSTEQWNEVIDINLTGTFNTIKSCINALKETQGYFITIASLAGTNFFEQGSAYNASKFGVVGFTQAVMLDLRKYGIKVSTIMPGSVASYFNNHVPNPKDEWKIQPEDIGELVVDLLKMNPRTLPSKIEVRPSMPPKG